MGSFILALVDRPEVASASSAEKLEPQKQRARIGKACRRSSPSFQCSFNSEQKCYLYWIPGFHWFISWQGYCQKKSPLAIPISGLVPRALLKPDKQDHTMLAHSKSESHHFVRLNVGPNPLGGFMRSCTRNRSQFTLWEWLKSCESASLVWSCLDLGIIAPFWSEARVWCCMPCAICVVRNWLCFGAVTSMHPKDNGNRHDKGTD